MKSEIRSFLQVVSFLSSMIETKSRFNDRKRLQQLRLIGSLFCSLICAERTLQSFHWIEIGLDRCISLTKHRIVRLFYDFFVFMGHAMNGKTLSAWFSMAGSSYWNGERKHKRNWIKKRPLKCFWSDGEKWEENCADPWKIRADARYYVE